MPRVRPASILPVVVLALLPFVSAPVPAEVPLADSRPKLVIQLIFDQLRGDYLTRWEKLFSADGGFRRLTGEGAWFQNCHYPYANTITGAGHATISTGCSPDRHGIIGNDWYERNSRKSVNCVGSERHTPVPPPADKKKTLSADPNRLLVETLADAFKAQLGSEARVVALSLKDRSAILPGGRTPDACYWADKNGQFITSTYYRDRPHAWVEAFNASGRSDQWFGKQWDRLRPKLDYATWSGPDDVRGESSGSEQGRTFPHPFDGGKKKSKTTYYSALACSPYGNEVLLALAKQAIEAEKLGSRATPDFLSISFSSNDLVGHAWGPDSQEVLDTTLRTDLLLRDLFAFLDDKVGKGRYTVALTADHGVCPLPEVSRSRGLEARRVAMPPILAAAEQYLNDLYPAPAGDKPDTGKWIESTKSNMLYLDHKRVRSRGARLAKVETALAGWMARQTGIAAAYARSAMAGPTPADDPYFVAVRRSFHPERSGDVLLVNARHHLLSWSTSTELTGTTHGAPHAYDTHVPLLVMGPGVKAGPRQERVSPEHSAVLLAGALGIRPPAQAAVKLPDGLFATKK